MISPFVRTILGMMKNAQDVQLILIGQYLIYDDVRGPPDNPFARSRRTSGPPCVGEFLQNLDG
jgi:hypothetical protein